MREANTLICPACSSTTSHATYQCNAVPVHSVKLVGSIEESLALTKGNIALRLCAECDLVWNSDFDESLMQYGAGYEETQAYSATFSRHQNEMAQEMVKQWGLRDKTVLEIGCGKGEFLHKLRAHGIAKGIGYDPGFDSSRAIDHQQLEFFTEFFPPKDRRTHTVDAYCCVMTLEHIAQVGDFIGRLREYIADGSGLVFIQVPAAERVFSELAFWDIYYEHCNYFSADSLTALMRRRGFEVIEQGYRFDDQYLFLVARPLHTKVNNLSQKVNSIEFAKSVRRFSGLVKTELDKWRSTLIGKNILLWGAASKAVGLISAIPELAHSLNLVDINPNKHQSYLPATELKIHSPEEFKGQDFDLILVANPVYIEEVKIELAALSISGEVVGLDVKSL